MDSGLPPSLFVNDGSFMERFRQLQQEKEKQTAQEETTPKQNNIRSAISNSVGGKTSLDSRAGNSGKATVGGSGGKLAFSLKHKSKVVTPSLKLGEDEEEDNRGAKDISDNSSAKRQKLCRQDTFDHSSERGVVAYILIPFQRWCKEMFNERFGNLKTSSKTPFPPSDPTVKNVADKLASFVAKNGRQIEHITRQKNPGDTPFKFLFDSGCAEYKYYEYRLREEEKALGHVKASLCTKNAVSSTSTASSCQRSYKHRPNYQTPASALYNVNEGLSDPGESSVPTDPIARMEYFAKKAAEEERRRPPKQSRDEMPPPASLQAGPAKRGHHMGDFIPQEELEKFLATCNDAAAQKAAKEAAEKARIQADNIGHRLLSKMGWREGEGVGGSRKGNADPIMAGGVKKDNLGVGAHQPGEVTPEDDIYEQYKKRMMLGYRHRPNPLGNPRKAYY